MGAKADLYRKCDLIRHNLCLPFSYQIDDTKQLLSTLVPTLKIEEVPFVTNGLRGMCCCGEDGIPDVILLNSNRALTEQNFDCMHEYIHLQIHRNIHNGSFLCSELIIAKQKKFIEWEANEGSAQVLIPYQDFIPRYVYECRMNSGSGAIIPKLANFYSVTEAVIDYRITSLSYEIYQYKEGCPINCIEILSKRERERRNIIVPYCVG